MRRLPFLLALLSLIHARVEAAPVRPHVLLILLDDMGYGDLACYNPNSKIPTPHINRLAREGMRFTDAHAAGALCHPSRYGLMTGRYPWRARTGIWPRQAVIHPDRPTLASLLRGEGYRTAMVGKWHLGFDENGYDQPLPGGPMDRGFETFFGIRASTDIPPYFYIRDRLAVAPPTDQVEDRNTPGWSRIQGEFWRGGGIAPGLELKDVLPRFADEAVEILKGHASRATEKPLFLYLAFPAPHTPWLPDAGHRGSSRAGMYGDFAAMVDTQVGRVLDQLEASGMKDDTLVLLSSDNGPVWYPHDARRFAHDAVGPLRGMKSDAYEGGHRMPFLARWPGRIAPGSTSDQTICFVDVMATLADVVGLDMPKTAGADSFSFLSVLEGRQAKDQPVRPALAVQSGGGIHTLRDGDWKLIDGLGSGGFTEPRKLRPEKGQPSVQLFHLGEDPSETHDVAREKPEVAVRLSQALDLIRKLPGTRPGFEDLSSTP